MKWNEKRIAHLFKKILVFNAMRILNLDVKMNNIHIRNGCKMNVRIST